MSREWWVAMVFSIVAFCAAGCGEKPLESRERALLDEVVERLEPMETRYREFGRFGEGIERGSNFISYTHNSGSGDGTPLLNPSYFWFKVSLAKDPVEAADLQPPILTAFVPRFDKYLKFRLVCSNEPLAEEMKRFFYQAAIEAGAQDPRWGKPQGPRTRGRLARHGAGPRD